MKKLLAVLSMAAVVAPAFADAPVAGTTDSPNYYIIKANRGVPYLGYSAEGIQTDNGKTNLVRTNAITAANVWAITPGTAEGSVFIKNYTADAYLMDFVKEGASTYANGATAVTVSTPVDITLQDMGGAYAINLKVENAASTDCITLDAPGSGEVCGNWHPTPAGQEGGSWWFTKLEIAEGETVQDALFRQQVEPVVNGLKLYIQYVPQAAAELQAGIDAIYAMAPNYDEAKVNEARNAACASANEKLVAGLNGNTYLLRNNRRVTTATEGAYLAADVAADKYCGTTDPVNDKAMFVLNAKDGGYTVFNAATNTYIGTTLKPVANEADAQIIYPILYAAGQYAGLALCTSAEKNTNGFNWQSWDNGNFGDYYITDPGSIWSLVNANPEDLVAELVAPIAAQLTPYSVNVPMVAEIMTKAVADLNALKYSANVAAEAEEIRANAINDANARIVSQLASKTYAIKSLRCENYLCVGDTNFDHADDYTSDNAIFTFKPVENGGFKVLNAATGIYVGPKTTAEGSNELTRVENEADAIVCYPALHRFTDASNDLFGVAFYLDADKSGNVFDMNNGVGLHSYIPNDLGAVFGVFEATGSALIDCFEMDAAPAATGIYDLSGRKLSAPVKGINIINGRKVLVK